MFSQEPRCIYTANQLGNVICQLRFPEILAISSNAPVDFQEAIRADYPQYSSRRELMAPRPGTMPGPNPKPQPTTNHQFVSADGVWRINLSSCFISLACTRYTRWEDFAAHLDKPLAAFIRIYKPAYFERVGLRYLNFFSRKSLKLEDTSWRELFSPCYLGLLNEDDVAEQAFSHSTVDAELPLRGGCRVKIHAGPGMVHMPGNQDKEVKFIFDQDLYMPGKIAVNLSAGALQTLHAQAYPIFRGAITDKLHDAMDPQ